MAEQSLLNWAAVLAPAAFVYASFKLAEENISDKTREDIKDWLENRELNVLYFGEVFNALFTERHWSVACVVRSCIASIISLLIISLITLSLSAESSTLYDQSVFTLSVQVFLIGLGLNLIPDYFSLMETRWVLTKMDGAHGFKQLLWILFDFIVSIGIFMMPVIIILTLPVNGTTAPLWEFMGVYEEDLLSRLDLRTDDIALSTKVFLFFDNLLALNKTSFLLFFICILTTVLTSVWIWIYFVAALFFKHIKCAGRVHETTTISGLCE